MNKTINAFLVGAQKSGTTSLYGWLGQHPRIEAPWEIKDYHFFSDDDLFRDGIQHLESFYRMPDGIRVHAAVNYLYFSDKSAERIFNYNSEAKIVVCLRNPIDRAISAYKYCRRTLRETKPFREALNREMEGHLSTHAELADNTYLTHGYYADQLQAYFERFGRERVHVILYEHISSGACRDEVMRGLCRFLGCDSDFSFKYSRLNASGASRSDLVTYLLRKARIGNRLRFVVPLRVRKRIGRLIDEMNISSRGIQVDISPSDINWLEDIYRERNASLSVLLGRQTEWVR